VIGWEDYTLVISFLSKGFPYKDQIEELFIVMVYCMLSQRVTSSTFALISPLTATYFTQRHPITYLWWKCRLTQSVSWSIYSL